MKNNEIAVIFKKKIKDGVLIFTPYDMVLGHQDKKSKSFITRSNKTYNYMFESDDKFGYGLRQIIDLKKVKDLKEEKETVLNFLKNLAIEYFSMIRNCYFYFWAESLNEYDNLALVCQNKKTGAKQLFYEEDIDIAIKCMKKNSIINFNAKNLKEKVKSEVIGQDDAIDKIVTILWQNMRGYSKGNILLIGPTGVGKTEIIRSISKKINVPFATIDATTLTASGFVGDSVGDVIQTLVENADYDLEKASRGIIYIDEIDKKASRDVISDVGTTSIQNELLKLLEDGEYTVKRINEDMLESTATISTKNITFVVAGAFSELQEIKEAKDKVIGFNKVVSEPKKNIITPDSLTKYGIKKELLGRLPNIIELNSLTEEDLIKIMKNPHNKTIQAKINLLKDLGIDTVISDDVYKVIAHNSIKLGLGARGLIGNVENLFNNAISEVSDNPNNYSKLIITEETVSNPKKYSLIKK